MCVYILFKAQGSKSRLYSDGISSFSNWHFVKLFEKVLVFLIFQKVIEHPKRDIVLDPIYLPKEENI